MFIELDSLSTEWVDYVEEPMKYQALRPHFFSVVGSWRVLRVSGWVGWWGGSMGGWVCWWAVVGWVMGWVDWMGGW